MRNANGTEHKTNEEVLEMVEERRLLMRTILQRKESWVGHIGYTEEATHLRELCFWIEEWKARKSRRDHTYHTYYIF